jgi:hypothetical protein
MKRENLSYKQVVNDAIRECFTLREARKATVQNRPRNDPS